MTNQVASEMRAHYKTVLEESRDSPFHYANCWRDHLACAMERLLDEVDRLQRLTEADRPLCADETCFDDAEPGSKVCARHRASPVGDFLRRLNDDAEAKADVRADQPSGD